MDLSSSYPKLDVLLRGLDVGIVPCDAHGKSSRHHQHIIQIQRPLMRDEVSFPSKRVLDDTADVPGSNHGARGVQQPDVSHPRQLCAPRRRLRVQPAVPCRRNPNEEPEDEDLQHETAEDDVLTALHAVRVGGFDEHGGAAGLDEEAEDVAADEDLCEPGGADDGVGGGVGALDEAAEDHVDGGGEEDGGDEDEDGLYYVGHLSFEVLVGGGAGGITDGFELEEVSVWFVVLYVG